MASPGSREKKNSRHINTIEDKEASPNTFSGPHFHRLLSVLLSKYNCQFTTKKNLTIHMIFCICSIVRVYILHKPKATRLPASWSNEALEKQNIYIKSNVVQKCMLIAKNHKYNLKSNMYSLWSNIFWYFIQFNLKHHVAANLVGEKVKIEMKFFKTWNSSQCIQTQLPSNLHLH